MTKGLVHTRALVCRANQHQPVWYVQLQAGLLLLPPGHLVLASFARVQGFCSVGSLELSRSHVL